jgi:flagellar basal-body rod protein FlgB
MGPIHLFDVVSQHNRWLSVRQTTVAGNIANANTPGYVSLDVPAFEAALESAQLALAATQPGHISPAADGLTVAEAAPDESSEIYHSGNNVSLEREMIKEGEVNRAFSLNMGVIKAFHRMLLTSAKG